MPTIKFTVDSALLAELGERLVGKPYIALAELVKNSYDADATKAKIELNTKKRQIIVADNGHGMDFNEFESFWMRIGSTHKEKMRFSRNLERSMTGSKGVGRLAVQYLAKEISLATVSEYDLKKRLNAHVEWEKAIKAGDLTEATAEYDFELSDKPFKKGTRIILRKLKHSWDSDFIEGLAREIWWLKPPFRSGVMAQEDPEKIFEIEFISPVKEYVETFNKQMEAILNIWYARLVGKNEKGNVTLALEYVGEEPIIQNFTIPNCRLDDGDFEIRIYHLFHRQPFGIKVQEARDYFDKFGGVHVYDGGFHLPYYGNQENDWLGIEFDHSHRLTLSKLLPSDMKIPQGLQFLPTLSRIFGVVNVDTSKEPKLEILITRDRLQESVAFRNLRFMIRWALDYYSFEEKRRSLEEEITKVEVKPSKVVSVEEVLTKYESEIPEKTFEALSTDVKNAVTEIETENEATVKQVSLIGPLATAGISSVAYQHEVGQQFSAIEGIIKDMENLTVRDKKLRIKLNDLKERISSWVERTRATNALFSYFTDAENIKRRERFPAKRIVDEIKKQVQILLKGIPVNTDRIDKQLLLPKASLIEWSSIFQNVFLNAFNAMVDSKAKIIDVSSRVENSVHEILVQNTGVPIDLNEAPKYFEPFERKSIISPERKSLGYGGTGLGLTIVRLIARSIGCQVSFVKPEKGFKTAFSIKWREY